MGELEEQAVAGWERGYLSTLAEEFSLQNIFYMRSIMFSIYSRLRQPSSCKKEYLHRDRSDRK